MKKVLSIGPLSAPSTAGNAIRRADRENGSLSEDLRIPSGRALELLCENFSIGENPFGVTPNPRFLYQGRSHAEARASLIVGLECGLGFQALIAAPGMGKTTILFDLLERFNGVARTAFLFQLQGDSRDFLRSLISELGSEGTNLDLTHIQDAINSLLARERRAGKRTLIIIDEAQSLSASVLETVRLLSNFETPSEKLVQIVLAGQPQLAQQLASSNLTQLQQRISILKTLLPFDLEDTKNYIEHRLKIAGYRGQPLFTQAGLEVVWERSHGIPREINTICFNALLMATAVGSKQIDFGILGEVIADRDQSELSRSIGNFRKLRPTSQVTGEVPFENRPAYLARRSETRSAESTEYLRFYNLTRDPFEASPDPCFLCFMPSHNAALAALYCGILQGKDVLTLVGDPGTGKTLITACLLELLKLNHIRANYTLGKHLSHLTRWRSLAGTPDWSSFHNMAKDHLINNRASKSMVDRTCLLVDQAQEISIDTLRELQLLTNVQHSQQQTMMQLVLIGRTEMDQMFAFDEFRKLRNRISVRSRIRPLNEGEIEKYIVCRLRITNPESHCASIFQQGSMPAIGCYSRGIPRLINRICHRALIRGHALRQVNISEAIIEEVAAMPSAEMFPDDRTPLKPSVDANETLKAVKILFEARVKIDQSRSEAGSSFQPGPRLPFAS